MTAPAETYPSVAHEPTAPPAAAPPTAGPPTAGPPTAAGPGRPRRRRGRLLALALAGTLALGGAFAVGTLVDGSPSATTTGPTAAGTAATAASADTPASTGPVAPLGDAGAGTIDAAAVLREVGPAVVAVRTTALQVSDQLQPVTQQGAGSGFVVGADGTIVTNAHVVEGATSVQVAFSDGQTADGTVLGTDPLHDLAVIKVDRAGLPTVTLADSSEVAVGQPVVAIGNALALPGGPTVTTGIVSAVDRTITEPNGVTLEGLLQTDAAINPGNSGGPLLDAAGRVVGVNTAGASEANDIGFAVASDTVGENLDALTSGTTTGVPFLGVQTTDVTAAVQERFDLPTSTGALVAGVQPGTAAAKAGLRPGDVVTRLGDAEVTSSDDLSSALRRLAPGDRTTVSVERGTGTSELPVRVGARGTGAEG